MEKDKLSGLENKSSVLTEKELEEFEKLKETFGKFGNKIIEGNSVYGKGDNKKEYLGTKEDFYRYGALKNKKSTKNKGTYHKTKFLPETYNEFNL